MHIRMRFPTSGGYCLSAPSVCLRKNGFHYYTLSKLLLMLMPVLFLDRSFVGIGNIMIGILFIALYFYLLRSLGVFSSGSDNNHVDDDADLQE